MEKAEASGGPEGEGLGKAGLEGVGGTLLCHCSLGWVRPFRAQTPLLGADGTRLQDTDARAGRKGAAELPGLGRRYPHPLAASLALITDTVFFITICIACTLTHAWIS